MIHSGEKDGVANDQQTYTVRAHASQDTPPPTTRTRPEGLHIQVNIHQSKHRR